MDQAASVLGRAGHAVLIDTGTLAFEYIPLPAQLALVIVDTGVSRRLESSEYGARRRELEAGDRHACGTSPRENRRVAEVAAILREPGQPRLDELGPIFAEGHESLRVDFEVTIPELDLLVALAVEEGAVAARMTGGGFGGSIVALVERGDADAFAERVLARYRERVRRQGRRVRRERVERSGRDSLAQRRPALRREPHARAGEGAVEPPALRPRYSGRLVIRT